MTLDRTVAYIFYLAAGLINAFIICKAMSDGSMSAAHGFNLFCAVYFAAKAATI